MNHFIKISHLVRYVHECNRRLLWVFSKKSVVASNVFLLIYKVRLLLLYRRAEPLRTGISAGLFRDEENNVQFSQMMEREKAGSASSQTGEVHLPLCKKWRRCTVEFYRKERKMKRNGKIGKEMRRAHRNMKQILTNQYFGKMPLPS